MDLLELSNNITLKRKEFLRLTPRCVRYRALTRTFAYYFPRVSIEIRPYPEAMAFSKAIPMTMISLYYFRCDQKSKQSDTSSC